MKEFSALFDALDQTTKTKAKVDALAAYFASAADTDKLWTIALLSGRRPKRTITTTLLRTWAAASAELPDWLFDESYAVTGDLAETIALVLPKPAGQSDKSLSAWITQLQAVGQQDEDCKRAFVLKAWAQLPDRERFVFNKLITGGFRMGVSQKLMTRALSKATSVPETELAHRLMGAWTPYTVTFHDLVVAPNPAADLSKPYPFYLAYQLDGPVEDLSDPSDWAAEYKWDGIRGQLILREGSHFLWSRGEELMTDRFPEFARALDVLPQGTVLDGEVLVWKDEAPLPFGALQKRIGRKSVPKKLLQDAPVILYAYDLLEADGIDMRDTPYEARRARLEKMMCNMPEMSPVRLSPQVTFSDWDQLARVRGSARDAGAEGVMLKRRAAPYLSGRKKGDWWKWKLDPLTIDAVMIYAQAGHGRRANLFTDFTFAVWDGDALVPFAKAYSGLTDAEFGKITQWVRKNTRERFGPVRSVTPHHVFEVAFEGIQASTRHKSGVALRFPRISRWRHDKPMSEAATLDDLRNMLATYG